MFAKILVPIDISYDNSDWQKPALTVASQFAQLSGASIHALTIVPSNLLAGYYPNLQLSDVAQEAKKKLEAVVRSSLSKDVPATLGVESGGICAEILRVARRIETRLEPGMDRHGVGPGGVTLTMQDGTQYTEEVEHCLGSVERPMTFEDVVRKFRVGQP